MDAVEKPSRPIQHSRPYLMILEGLRKVPDLLHWLLVSVLGLGRLFLLPVLLVLSWWITGAVLYGYWTNHVQAYYDSLIAFGSDSSSTFTSLGFTSIVIKDAQRRSCTIKVQKPDPDFTRILTAVSQVVPKGLALTVMVNQFVVDDPSQFGLVREIPLVELSDSRALFRNNRDVTFRRPPGPLTAELRALATAIASQQVSGVKPETARDLAQIVAAQIDDCHGLSKWADKYWFLRLISGWVEGVIIILSVFCVLVFFAELILTLFGVSTPIYAVRSAEEILDLIPYVGFFGTIFGMSGALWILGSIDISDAVQKATQIGPITGNISLAMETSQLGLIFFIVASLLGAIIRIAFKHPA